MINAVAASDFSPSASQLPPPTVAPVTGNSPPKPPQPPSSLASPSVSLPVSSQAMSLGTVPPKPQLVTNSVPVAAASPVISPNSLPKNKTLSPTSPIASRVLPPSTTVRAPAGIKGLVPLPFVLPSNPTQTAPRSQFTTQPGVAPGGKTVNPTQAPGFFSTIWQKLSGRSTGGGSGDGSTPHSENKPIKISLPMAIGALAVILLVIGGGVAYYLSQQNQEIRQQASTGSTYGVNLVCPPDTTKTTSDGIDFQCTPNTAGGASLVCPADTTKTTSDGLDFKCTPNTAGGADLVCPPNTTKTTSDGLDFKCTPSSSSGGSGGTSGTGGTGTSGTTPPGSSPTGLGQLSGTPGASTPPGSSGSGSGSSSSGTSNAACGDQVPVNTQFRPSGNGDWISGSDITNNNYQIGQSIDVNCFAKNGSAQLTGGYIQLTDPTGTTTQVSNSPSLTAYITKTAGQYTFTCKSTALTSCSDADSFTIFAAPASTTTTTPPASTTTTTAAATTTSSSTSCNSACSSDSFCQSLNSNYVCYNGNCRLATNVSDSTCYQAPSACNSSCSSDSQCQSLNSAYVCYNSTCRLATNVSDTTCYQATGTTNTTTSTSTTTTTAQTTVPQNGPIPVTGQTEDTVLVVVAGVLFMIGGKFVWDKRSRW